MTTQHHKAIATGILALIASVSLTYGYNGVALFFSLWTIAGIIEMNR